MPGGCCSGLLVAVLLASPVVASHTEGDAQYMYAIVVRPGAAATWAAMASAAAIA